MEDDKVAFLEEFGLKLDKQRKIINVLRRERDALNEDMVAVTCLNQTRNDEKTVIKISSLVEELKICNAIIKTEKEDHKELEVQIRKVRFLSYYLEICSFYLNKVN